MQVLLAHVRRKSVPPGPIPDQDPLLVELDDNQLTWEHIVRAQHIDPVLSYFIDLIAPEDKSNPMASSPPTKDFSYEFKVMDHLVVKYHLACYSIKVDWL